jgi:hypothetical protein
LPDLFLDPEDGAVSFFRNVDGPSTHYTALYPRRQNSKHGDFEAFYSIEDPLLISLMLFEAIDIQVFPQQNILPICPLDA